MKPIERRPIATMAARMPGPMIVTKSSAQISELMERDETIRSRARGRTSQTEGVVLRAAQKAIGTARTMPSPSRCRVDGDVQPLGLEMPVVDRQEEAGGRAFEFPVERELDVGGGERRRGGGCRRHEPRKERSRRDRKRLREIMRTAPGDQAAM